MAGWAILLLWADHQPMQRKDILLLTLPVVAGYVVIELHNLQSGATDLLHTLPLLAPQAGMTELFIIAYMNSHRLDASWVRSEGRRDSLLRQGHELA